jgi:hypothetical protein
MSNSENMDVRRHHVTDAADLDLYLGPDTFETETVVTAICGEVSGELDRVESRDEAGGIIMVYEARIAALTSCCAWPPSRTSWRARSAS